MTITTIRGSIGRVRNMYIFFAAAVASSDIAIYVAATHGGLRVAKETIDMMREAVFGLIIVYFADILGAFTGPFMTTWLQNKNEIIGKGSSWGNRGTALVRGVASAASMEMFAYFFLLEPWWNLWMFYLSMAYEMKIAVEEAEQKETLCKWEADNSSVGRRVSDEYAWNELYTPEPTFHKGRTKVTLMGSPGNEIYYTTDGSLPTKRSTRYIGPFFVLTSVVIKYIEVDQYGNQSSVKAMAYTIQDDGLQVAANPAGGSFNHSIDVTFTTSSGLLIVYYTLDGSIPTANSTIYTNPIKLRENTTLKYFTMDFDGNKSAIMEDVYTIDTTVEDSEIPEIEISRAGDLLRKPVTITLTMTKPGQIYYTLDGSEPTKQSTLYTGPLTISTETVLRYRGWDTFGLDTGTYTQHYTIDRVKPTVRSTPGQGWYMEPVTVRLLMDEPGTIFYNINEGDPFKKSYQYVDPLYIDKTEYVNYYGVDNAGNRSLEKMELYEIWVGYPAVSGFRDLYIIQHDINSLDYERATELVENFKKMGVKNVKYVHHGTNNRNLPLQDGTIPRSSDVAVIEIWAKPNAGIIREKTTPWYKDLLGPRKLAIWQCCGYPYLRGLGWLDRSPDDNFSPDWFTGIQNPLKALEDEGYGYVEYGTMMTAANYLAGFTGYSK